MEYLSFDKVIGILGIILAVVGVILTIKANKKVIPFSILSNLSVLRKNTKNLERFKIVYNDLILDQAGVSNFVFWNGGNQILNFTDSSPKLPFKLCFSSQTQILDAFLIYESNVYNSTNIKFIPENNFIDISFDYLEPKEGFILKIIHTKKDFSKINIQGAFKGSKSISKSELLTDETEFSTNILSLLFTLSFFIYFTLGGIKNSSIWIKILCVVGAAFFMFLFIRILYIYLNHRSKKIPTKLRKNL